MTLTLKTINFNIPFIDYIYNFLKGDNLTLEFCNKIYNNLQLINSNYIDDINKIKIILNASNKTVYNNIFFIKTKKNITDQELLLLIRFINICHKEKYFIVINNKLVYIPQKIINIYSEINIYNYINNKIIEYKYKLIKQIITKYYKRRLKNNFLAKIVSFISYNIILFRKIHNN